MARSDASILGDFTGRIGNLVVYKLNGKTVIRTRPAGRTKKVTPRQKQNQEDFKHVMQFMQSLTKVINTGFYDVTQGRFAYHSAFSANLKAYKEAGRPTGLEWLKLSEGIRDGAEDLKLESLGENRFKISWGEPSGVGWSGNHDRVFVVAVNKSGDKYHYVNVANAQRHQQEAELNMNSSQCKPEDEIHFFLFFQDVEGSFHKKNLRNVSSSQWVGKIVMLG